MRSCYGGSFEGQSSDVLLNVMENMAIGIVLVEISTKRVLFINKVAQEITGYNMDNLGDKTSCQFLRRDSNSPCMFEDGSENLSSVIDITTFSGGSKTIKKSVSLFEYAGQKVILEVFMDLTDEKHQEKKIKKTLEEYEQNKRIMFSLMEDLQSTVEKEQLMKANLERVEAAFDSSTDALAISDCNGRYIFKNQIFVELFGDADSIDEERAFTDHGILLDHIHNTSSARNWRGRLTLAQIGGEKKLYQVVVENLYSQRNKFNGKIWRISDLTEQLLAEERVQRDLREKTALLEKSRNLQMSLIQKSLPMLREFSLHSLFMPCEQLGGDFFRIRKGNSLNKLLILLGDCTGHGVQSSLDASILTSIVDSRLYALFNNSRTDLFLEVVNREFCSVAEEDQFPTMFVAVIDLNDNSMYYSSANGEVPILIRKNKVLVLDKPEGMHLNLSSDSKYERKSINLIEDDKILFFSDAILEIPQGGNLRPGYPFLLGLLDQLNLSKSSGKILAELLSEFRASNGGFPLADDTTIIMVEHIKPIAKRFDYNELSGFMIMREFLKKTMLRFDYSLDETEQTEIAFEEIFINAFTHGNSEDLSKPIKTEIIIDAKEVFISVTDSGEGFCHKEVPDPQSVLFQLLEEDNEEEYTHGRGLFVARQYVEQLIYNDKGNKATILKQRKSSHYLLG
ncbi:MAG: SpoIIE family protein phosphatase [Spirochaetales bacterium]|nr:SpoIIE family protein phosphatase [Spirochaetales bacterium]